MNIFFDPSLAFEQFMADADLKPVFKADGTVFSGSRQALEHAFRKTLEPIQALLDDAAEARAVLFRHGYGNDAMPLSLLVDDLVARLIDAVGPQDDATEPLEPQDDCPGMLNPDTAFDIILGRTPARPNLGLTPDSLFDEINFESEP